MKTFQRTILLPLVFLALAALSSCGKQEEESAGEQVQPVNIAVREITPASMIDAVRISGSVKAFEDVMMSPEEGGIVKEWVKKKGERVKKGDLIVTLRDEVIKAGYDAAQAQYKMAELNVDKQKSVYDQQGISELQYTNMLYGRDAAKANADLMKARWERTQLRSPIDGVVDNTMPNVGEMAPPGMPIARIVNTSSIKIQAEVPELYSGTINTGMPASVTFDAVPDLTLEGNVSFVGTTVSAANRTLTIEIVLPNPNRRIKPEMVAKVELIRARKTNAILVSENLVQLVDRDRYVLYVERDGKAEERRVEIGGRQGNLMEILSGVTFGERLIVSGTQNLINGSPVIITE